jgi:Holliday junction resolvase RusA-like endonuclease
LKDTSEQKARTLNSKFVQNLRLFTPRELPLTWDIGPATATLDKRPSVAALLWARTALDAGNLSKSSLDALEGIVYRTDASVRSVLSLSQRPKGAPHIGLMAFARYEDPELTTQISLELLALLPNLLLQLENFTKD